MDTIVIFDGVRYKTGKFIGAGSTREAYNALRFCEVSRRWKNDHKVIKVPLCNEGEDHNLLEYHIYRNASSEVREYLPEVFAHEGGYSLYERVQPFGDNEWAEHGLINGMDYYQASYEIPNELYQDRHCGNIGINALGRPVVLDFVPYTRSVEDYCVSLDVPLFDEELGIEISCNRIAA